MKIIHRISASLTSTECQTLASWGVEASPGFASFDINESHPRWADIQRWAAESRAVDIVRTTFTPDEVRLASVLQLSPDWHCGYPQPDEGSFGYRRVTYDLAGYCLACGIGLRQNAPFQLKAEPKWGDRGLMQVNWVFDEYFVRPAVYERVFEPLGVKAREVLGPGRTSLQQVLQLTIDEQIACDVSSLGTEDCPDCGRTKCESSVRGRFPAPLSPLVAPIAKTTTYFGSGASAYRAVLVSQELAARLTTHKVKGASLRPADPTVAER